MKYDITICTTAVTRPELHSQVFSDYIRFLDRLNCLWLIHIDPILGRNINQTLDNFTTIFKPYTNIHVEYKHTEVGGTDESFYNASKYLIRESYSRKEDSQYGVFWLEDDWKINEMKSLYKILQECNFKDRDYIMLRKRYGGVILSFNPGIWGWELFREICCEGIEKPFSEGNKNPERACVFPIKEKGQKVKTVHKHYCFEDMGREWQHKHNIHRTFRLGKQK